MNIRSTNSDSRFAELPPRAREEVRGWISAFERRPPRKPLGEWADEVARLVSVSLRREVSARTVRRKRKDLADAGGDWFALVDPRRLNGKDPVHRPTQNPFFREYWRTLVERSQRSTAAAHRALLRIWETRSERIPAYENFPGWPNIPEGWSEKNLGRLVSSKAELIAARTGIVAARERLPQVFTTRIGLWPGAVYQFDDVWHDNLIRHAGAVTRVLEFGAHDVFSGCRFSWGSKPRMPRVDDASVMRNLSEAEFRLFLCACLFNHGYSPQGTVLVVERGTAAISERVEEILERDTGGLVQVRRAGIEGKSQTVLRMWEGRGKGNPRHKSHIESLHNLIHNELGFLLGQLGKDWKNQPETTGYGGPKKLHGIAKYQQWLLDVAADMPPERRELLVHPLPDYHSEFLPLLQSVYDAMNQRSAHALEGWHEAGNVVTKYRLGPDSPEWMSADALPATARQIVLAAAREDPATWSRTVRLSPAEVWAKGAGALIPISPHTIADILLDDYAQSMRVRGAYFVVKNSSISPEPLRFSARVLTPEGELVELRDGDRWRCVLNPYDAENLLVCDEQSGRVLGIAKREHATNMLDFEKLAAAFGHRQQRTADRLREVRARSASLALQVQGMKEQNKKIVNGEAITPEEIEGAKLAALDRKTTKRIAHSLSVEEAADNLSAMGDGYADTDADQGDQGDQGTPADDASYSSALEIETVELEELSE